MQNKQVIRRCDLAIAKWFIDASIPFNAANSAYFQPMIDDLCSMSPRYKAPSMHCCRWDPQLHKNLHASGYWLKPACRFNEEEFEQHMTTTTGLLDVIERYAHRDSQLQTKLTSAKRIYDNVELDFGRQVALDERNTIILGNFHNL